MSFDPVEKPSHYAAGRQFETIDVIEDWALNYHLGNCVKYISRNGRKEGEQKALEDLKKARWYLDREITNRELKQAMPEGFEESVKEAMHAWYGDDRDFYDDLEQEEVEFKALGELPKSVVFGSDEDSRLDGKDLDKFKSDEIVTTYIEGDMILGIDKDGRHTILKHSDDVYQALYRTSDT